MRAHCELTEEAALAEHQRKLAILNHGAAMRDHICQAMEEGLIQYQSTLAQKARAKSGAATVSQRKTKVVHQKQQNPQIDQI